MEEEAGVNKSRTMDAAQWFRRLALAAGFLSAVADRFGLWGPPGAPNVAWGEWQPFVAQAEVVLDAWMSRRS